MKPDKISWKNSALVAPRTTKPPTTHPGSSAIMSGMYQDLIIFAHSRPFERPKRMRESRKTTLLAWSKLFRVTYDQGTFIAALPNSTPVYIT